MSSQLRASSSWTRRSTFQVSLFLGKSSMKTTSARAPARSASSMRLRKSSSCLSENESVKMDVLIVDGEIVDAALGRGDPGGHFPRLDHLVHERADERAVALR